MEYIEALAKELRNTYLALAFLVLTMVAVLVIITISSVSYYKDLKGFAKAKRKKKKKSISNRRKAFVSLTVSLAIYLVITVLGTISLSSKATDLKYDIDNEAICVSTENFTVTREEFYPYKSKTRQDYYITICNSSDELRVKEQLVDKAELKEGEYTGYSVVYGERSKLVLDVFKTKQGG